MHPGREQLVAVGDAELCTETIGDPTDPALLLIAGQMSSMLWWPDELCERLARSGLRVIRYDHRDTGRSTAYPPGRPGYASADLTTDALAVLDGLGVDAAHVAGISAGGGIAQELAASHPERVLSLTAISTTSIGPAGQDLPGPTAEYMAHIESGADLDWTDPMAVRESIVADAAALAGSGHTFDETAVREFVERDLARTRNPASLANHTLLAEGESAGDPIAALQGTPLLVIHGSADPLFPLAHGEALAGAVEGASLVVIDGGGHELHPDDLDQIAAAIASHAGVRP